MREANKTALLNIAIGLGITLAIMYVISGFMKGFDTPDPNHISKETTAKERIEDELLYGNAFVAEDLKQVVERYFKYPASVEYHNGTLGRTYILMADEYKLRSVYQVTAKNAFGVKERHTVSVYYYADLDNNSAEVYNSSQFDGWIGNQ